jgi:hypothetical protein
MGGNVARTLVRAVVVSVVSAAVSPALLAAGVKTEERTRAQFGGPLGGIVSHFGGKAAKEGVVETVAVVGDRKLTLSDESGRIVDLAEEKVYELDPRSHTYTVTTFEEMKKRFEEQRAKAQQEAEKAQKQQKDEPKPEAKEGEPAPEFDVDVRVSRTGEKRTIAGHEAAQWITRVSVYPKGSSLQQSGGMAIVNEQWLAKDVPELQEIRDFDVRYGKKMAELYGFDAASVRASADQMASLVAMYPGLVKALERMKVEGDKMEGTPLLSIFSLDLVRSAQQVAQAEKQDQQVTGISGFLAKKLMKKATGDPTQPKQALVSTTVEMLKITPEAGAADVAMPAGYTQK